MGTRINVGCGQTPTEGWMNFDNSPSVRLAGHTLLLRLGSSIGIVSAASLQFALKAQQTGVKWADAVKRIPVESNSTEVVYSSHMLEHLSSRQVGSFLGEARRVLVPGGILRIAVPDLAKLVEQYLRHGDADKFVQSTHLKGSSYERLMERLILMIVGARGHQWMYDASSLCSLMNRSGFAAAKEFAAGETRIPCHEPLALREREDESIYVEAHKPG